MRYRKKPVIIEAFQYTGDLVNHGRLAYGPAWAQDAFIGNVMFYDAQDQLSIRTLEGDHRVSIGDYIIQGVAGEIYPCKPDIFIATYDEVSEG